jgi:hypothetical protein
MARNRTPPPENDKYTTGSFAESRRAKAASPPNPAIEELVTDFVQGVAAALRLVCDANVAAQQWDVLYRIVAALPLTNAEYCQARNQLANPRRYVESGEPGAAQYELRMLLRRFQL